MTAIHRFAIEDPEEYILTYYYVSILHKNPIIIYTLKKDLLHILGNCVQIIS